MKGIAPKNVTAASFQPNENEMATHPITLKMEISGNTPIGPSRSWICLGSIESRDINEPEEFSSRS